MKKSQLTIKSFLSYIVVLNSIIFASTAYSESIICQDLCTEKIYQENYEGLNREKNIIALKYHCKENHLSTDECERYKSDQLFKKRFTECEKNSVIAFLIFQFRNERTNGELNATVISQDQFNLPKEQIEFIKIYSKYTPLESKNLFTWEGTNLILSGDNSGLIQLERTSQSTSGILYGENEFPEKISYFDALLTAKKDHSASAKIFNDVKVRCYESDQKIY